MGSISKGILGGFSGKVGNVIGGTWKGIDYMRSLPNKRVFTASPKQLEQQMKFALVMRFLQPLAGLLRIGYSDVAVQETGMNAAFSYTFKYALAGIFPSFSIDYPKVLVSKGNLPNALAPSLVVAAKSILTFSWTDNSGVGTASATDIALLVAYCPATRQVIYDTKGAVRSDMTGDLDAATFSGMVVETYISFLSADERTVATSIFMGEVTVS